MTGKFFAFFLLLISFLSFGQNSNKSFTVKQISETPIIDGVLDEAFWETADGPHDFQQFFPTDSILAKQQTDVKIVVSQTHLYIGATMKSIGDQWVTPSLKRDYRASTGDSMSFVFDTFNDGTNAFMFGINPYGVRREVLISAGGSDLRGFNESWDVKWKGESKIHGDYYTAEMAIPLTSFKFREGETKWRFQAYRFDLQTNERSTWHRVPQGQFLVSLAFMGDMHFEKPLGKSRTPLAIIPYLNTITERDFSSEKGTTGLKIGGDAKVSIGNGMNLDVTINPDFSNVEVDDIITNLTRFEVSLPEKRQFFIDNSDLFGSFGGSRDANPFFSRRIGIARDTSDNSIENRIIGGIRLSGKLNQNWRLGLLSIQTDEDLNNKIASNNNTMLALQKRVFSRSNVSMFYINRQSFKDYDFITREQEYNRVLGVDYNLASKTNRWIGKFYTHKSFQPDDNVGNLSAGAFLSRQTRRFNVFTDLAYINEDFTSDLGFVPRTDILKSATSFEKVFWPKKGSINSYSFEVFPIITWRPTLVYKHTDHDIMLSSNFELQNQSRFGLGFTNSYTFLTEEFDPTRTDNGIPLPGNMAYHYNSVNAMYMSNQANKLSVMGESILGRFFNGNIFALDARLALRILPKAQISLAINYNKISLPDPYPSADLWLVSPKIELTFSKTLFWSTLVQYSNGDDNLGINSRLQWRFAPLSDLFIVYNDNYFVNQFSPRYRSLNLKFTYWLNI
ncbi:DUF5916 domain-containing protein [Maribacter algicola]|uniref:DUF5916 domain-containing protein n=1 Tax=Meishania litoralis TaxID=3434685 RepID=A0ACC7LMU4_9FLAO